MVSVWCILALIVSNKRYMLQQEMEAALHFTMVVAMYRDLAWGKFEIIPSKLMQRRLKFKLISDKIHNNCITTFKVVQWASALKVLCVPIVSSVKIQYTSWTNSAFLLICKYIYLRVNKLHNQDTNKRTQTFIIVHTFGFSSSSNWKRRYFSQSYYKYFLKKKPQHPKQYFKYFFFYLLTQTLYTVYHQIIQLFIIFTVLNFGERSPFFLPYILHVRFI